MAQPQIDIITPNGDAPLDSKTGRELFEEAVRNLNGAKSRRESMLANHFNALGEAQQQVWLKAAGCPLLTRSLCVGGKRLTQWKQLKQEQRNRMMTAYRSIRVIAGGAV